MADRTAMEISKKVKKNCSGAGQNSFESPPPPPQKGHSRINSQLILQDRIFFFLSRAPTKAVGCLNLIHLSKSYTMGETILVFHLRCFRGSLSLRPRAIATLAIPFRYCRIAFCLTTGKYSFHSSASYFFVKWP